MHDYVPNDILTVRRGSRRDQFDGRISVHRRTGGGSRAMITPQYLRELATRARQIAAAPGAASVADDIRQLAEDLDQDAANIEAQIDPPIRSG
jgi:hypothetical protein